VGERELHSQNGRKAGNIIKGQTCESPRRAAGRWEAPTRAGTLEGGRLHFKASIAAYDQTRALTPRGAPRTRSISAVGSFGTRSPRQATC
jgi:hypothetical protein